MSNKKDIARRSQVGLHYEGPLPPSAEFDRYNITLPGAAERILAMAEKEQDHRHTMDRRAIFGNATLAFVGQIFALIVALAIIATGGYCIYLGNAGVGASIIISTLVGLIYAFNHINKPVK